MNTSAATTENPIENTHNYCTRKKCLFKSIQEKKKDINDYCFANFCISCGVNMGDCNPRQYCMKTYCPYKDEDK
jgi:hypothetical protein